MNPFRKNGMYPMYVMFCNPFPIDDEAAEAARRDSRRSVCSRERNAVSVSQCSCLLSHCVYSFNYERFCLFVTTMLVRKRAKCLWRAGNFRLANARATQSVCVLSSGRLIARRAHRAFVRVCLVSYVYGATVDFLRLHIMSDRWSRE